MGPAKWFEYRNKALLNYLVPLFQSASQTESKCECLSFENDFDLYENETAYRTHFHMRGFALRFVLKRRHKRTRKLPMILGRKLHIETSKAKELVPVQPVRSTTSKN